MLFTFYFSSIKENIKKREKLQQMYLHSTLVLLKSPHFCQVLIPYKHLHSTLVLLKLAIFIFIPSCFIFTFYFSSIKGINERDMRTAVIDLHSTLVLLKIVYTIIKAT